jgi:hypothetical protein
MGLQRVGSRGGQRGAVGHAQRHSRRLPSHWTKPLEGIPSPPLGSAPLWAPTPDVAAVLGVPNRSDDRGLVSCGFDAKVGLGSPHPPFLFIGRRGHQIIERPPVETNEKPLDV